MKINKYPDGTSYVNDTKSDCQTFKINSYEDLWHLNQYVDAFISKWKVKPNIVIPNLIDAQADRRFNEGESFGLKLVLEFLKFLPVKKYYIFHPHNPEVVEMMLGDRVEIIDNSEFIKKVICNIGNFKDFNFYKCRLEKNTILMSSDAGGFKPLMKLCDKINWQGETFSASKARFYNKKLYKSELVQIIDKKDFNGKDILIIDDICVYGGTFKGLSKLLRERNCGKLYLAVSHMTVQNLEDDPVTNYFDKVFTTNSKFDEYYEEDGEGTMSAENLEIIKMFNTNNK